MIDTRSCPSGKHGHESRKRANRHLATMRQQLGEPDVHVYRCERCGKFHVGHHKGNQTKAGPTGRYKERKALLDLKERMEVEG